MSLVSLWLQLTVITVACFFVWQFVPILVPIALLLLALGALVAAIVWLARRVERARGGPPPGPADR